MGVHREVNKAANSWFGCLQLRPQSSAGDRGGVCKNSFFAWVYCFCYGTSRNFRNDVQSEGLETLNPEGFQKKLSSP